VLQKSKLRNGIMIVAGLCFGVASLMAAQVSSSASLTGRVSSQEEGPMEGVLVTAKRAGSIVAVTVVSDSQGKYSFPRNRLEPGQYSIRIRAVGYELDGSGTVEVTAQKTAQLDLQLRKTDDLSKQFSNGEWLLSMTGTDQQKQALLGCVGCHTLERVVRSHYNGADFAKVVQRMGTYAQGTVPGHIQPRMPREARGGGGDMEARGGGDRAARLGQFVSTINLSSVSKWEYPLKTLPRPHGNATKVVITEYDLPRQYAQPHDAAVDSNGKIWYSDFGSEFLGMLDPKTAKIVEYPIPLLAPGYPTGSLDVGFDPDGYIWMGAMNQGAILKFDTKSHEFQTFKAPTFMKGDASRMAMVAPANLKVDGKIWVGADDEWQVNLKTGQWTAIDYSKGLPPGSPPADRLGSYGVQSDSKNNFYGMNLNGTYITRVDAKSMQVTPFATPTPNSGPRRGHMDPQDRLWFAEFRGNRIGMFDTKTEKFQEWALPSAWTNPYDAILDKNGYAWAGGMTNDHIVRVNTKTNEITDYLLPRTTNVRRVSVDNSTNPPTFWVGNNHGASIIRLEPLE